MSMILGNSSRPISVVQPRLLGYRATTSIFGTAVPKVYGAQRVPGNVIWYGDWSALPAAQNLSGKGLGANPAVGSQWNYQSALAIALCLGPLTGIGSVWQDKSILTLVTTSTTVTVPSGGGAVTVTPPSSGNFQFDHGVGRQDAYSVVANDYGSPGPVTKAGTQSTPMAIVGSGPGAGQYSVAPSGATANYNFNAADAGKQVVITYTYSIPNSNGTGAPTNMLQLSLFEGTLGQAAWGYLTTNHAGQALGYSELAYLANPSMALGSSGNLPNLSFETFGPLAFGGGIVDCDPSAVMYDILTNPQFNLGIPGSRVAALTQWSNYCVANGLFFSPLLDSQRAASDWLQDLLNAGNAAALWSEGVIKVVPYGDTTTVGNGVTFTPQTAPVYDLSEDDFLDASSGDTLLVIRPSVQDAYNDIQVEWSNRLNSYNPETVEEKDDWSISQYGLRVQSPAAYHFITTLPVAQLVANTILKNSVYKLPQYKFTLPWHYILLEPMDLVTITYAALGLNKLPVRITEIEENENGDLAITAEAFPWGTAQPTANPKQGVTPYVPQATADPGQPNTPIVVEATDRATQQHGYELWMGVSGGQDWGGCNVWLSTDNATYKQVGTLVGNTRMGTLLASLASHSDPDTTDTLSVDLGISRGVLATATAADADNFATLCLVENELISYQTATLVTGNQYNLGTYLRRGILGSAIAAHGSGAQFMRVDAEVYRYQFDPVLIGKTIYLKFQGFNRLGLMLQDLSNVTAHTYTIAGLSTGVIDLEDGVLTSSGKLPPNVPNNITNNATVDSVDAGTSATIRVYGPSGVGTAATRWVGSATSSIPAASLTGYAYSTKYAVVYDGTSFSVLTSFMSSLADKYLWAGVVTTCAHGGSGGSSGGGGSAGGDGGKPTF